jgi:flagellar assembly protein FliH
MNTNPETVGGASNPKHVSDDLDVGLDSARLDEMFERGRAQGYLEGCLAERSLIEAQQRETPKDKVEKEAKRVAEFELLRSAYFQAVEFEVVKLAFSIAARVLRRELQVDPLLQAGTVRAALGQIAEKGTVRLRVPADEVNLWLETMQHLPGLSVRPTVIADRALCAGDCKIESDIGSADLGLRSQLLEIAETLLDASGPSVDDEIEPEWRETAVHS